jgi:two-component system secretion response regulator SsrB
VTQTVPARPLRILVVDDHALVVQGIKALLAPMPNWQIVGHADNGLVAMTLCARLSPDLVLLDLGLSGMCGADVLRTLKARWPSLRVIVLTASEDESTASRVIRDGAAGFVLKRSSYKTLVSAITTVTQNRQYIDPGLDVELVHALVRSEGVPSILSLRERQVLKMILDGHRNRDIAEKLSISLKTVQTHRLNLMRKLDAHNIIGLMQASKRIGLI